VPRNPQYILLVPWIAACATAPSGPREAIAWPPGHFYLEATVSYTGGSGPQDDLYVADLYVQPDQSMRLDSHVGGVCRDPTPAEIQRDYARRVRTFRCGDVTWELRPGSGTVSGEVQAVVQEGYTITQCIRYGANGACEQTASRVATRAVRRTAPIRVREQLRP
jgi:hypothetical protein